MPSGSGKWRRCRRGVARRMRRTCAPPVNLHFVKPLERHATMILAKQKARSRIMPVLAV